MRIRTIKPEFWASESNSRLSRDARLLFIGLLNMADDEGRLRGSVGFITGQVFPNDADGRKVVERCLPELLQSGKATKYTADGDSYIFLPAFARHQKVDKRYPSKLPAPPIPPDKLAGPAECPPLEQGTGNREVEQGSGSGTGSAPTALSGSIVEDEVFEYWRAVMSKTAGALFTKDRREKVRARLAEGRSVADLKQAVDGCSKTPHNMGDNETGERWDDLTLICRSGAHVERFMRNATAPPKGSAKRAQPMLGLEGSGPLTATEGVL